MPSGDGFNRFVGGGANYDYNGTGWPFAGKQTTDTTDAGAIRFGAVVGTFVASPARTDWFLIGTGGTFTVPAGGATLYMAVNDTASSNNTGSYAVTYASGSAPAITTHPASQIIVSGQTATLTVVGSGTTPLAYQWYRGASPSTTTPIDGATSASYSTPALTASASHWVRVTNSFGTADSNTAALTVSIPQLTWNPYTQFSTTNGNPNGVWSYGWMDTGFATFTPYVNKSAGPGAFTHWYGWAGDETPGVGINPQSTPVNGVPPGALQIHPGNGNEPSVLRWTAPLTAAVRVTGQFLPGNSGQMQVAVRQNNTVLWSATDAGAFDLSVNVTAGDTLNFAVFGGYFFGDTGLQLTIATGAVSLPLVRGDSAKLAIGSFAGGTSIQVSASGTGDLVDSRFQTNPNGSVAAVVGSPWGFANVGAAYGSVSPFPSGDGINHFPGGGANYDYTGSGWTFAGKQTTDTTDPAAIRSGAVVGTFVATNPARSDWFLIGYGGTFTVPAGGATLYVAVNESYSSDNHGAYSLTFATPSGPAITTQPAGQAASVGASVSFSVVASGATGYQWRKNGVDISGATNASLVLTNVQASATGTYTVVATNGGGSVTSNAAALSLVAAGSTFDADAAGWTVVSFADLSANNFAVLGTYAATFVASGGNPGGYISSNDPDGGDFTFSAPAAFLGNRAGSVGATLTYDLIHPVGDLNYQAIDVVLVGNGVRLVWKRDPALAPAATAWTSVSVPLAPTAQWHVSTSDGALASAADFQNVLASLTGLYIRGEYTFGADTTGLDNVYLGLAVPGVPAVTGIAPSTVSAGATVTLTGRGFTGATAVSFNGTAAASFTVVSDLTITAVVPTGVTAGNVAVTTSGGTNTTTVAFTLAVPAPTANDRFDPGANGVIYAVAVQPDGKIIIGGGFTTLQPFGAATATNCARLARLNRDGTIDATFAAAASDTVFSLVLQPDGRILVGGDFTTISGTIRNRLARLNPNGTLDPGFDPNVNGRVAALALQADGKILLGGTFDSLQPNNAGAATTRTRFARLNGDGTLDSLSFSITNTEYGVLDVLALTDGSILVAGDVTTVAGAGRSQIFRITSAGALDTGFNPSPNGAVRRVVRQADGKILLGGEFTAVGSVTGTSLARLNADFTVDAGFNPAVGYSVYGIAPQADGRIVAGGFFSTVAGQTRQGLVRINPDGGLDPGFVANASATVRNLALQSDGSLVVVGDFTTLATHGRNRIARLLPDGSVERALIADTTNDVVGALAVQPDGKIILGGHFASTVAGVARSYVARLNADSTLDAAFNPAPNASVIAPVVLPDGKLLLGGRFTSIAGQSRTGLARFLADGTFDASFDAAINGILNGVAPQADGKIVIGGAFTSVGGQTRNRLARLNADGTLDPGFNPNVDGEIFGLALQGDGAIVLSGTFTQVAGSARNRLARVTAVGGLDANFDPNANGPVSIVAVQPDGGVLAAGSFTTIAGQSRSGFVRLTSNGSIDSTFNPAANGAGVLVLQADGKIVVGGSFTTIAGAARSNLARLNADGTLDVAFNPLADGSINAIALQPDGKTVLGGMFANVGGQPRGRLARLIATGPTATAISATPGTITLTRSGPLPELAWVTFERSTDRNTWTPLGAATRVGTTSNWQLTGQALPNDTLLYLRARAAAPTGVYGASSLVEHVQQYYAASTTVPTHHYTFNNGAVTDSVGTANGTLVGGATLAGGRLVLDGSSGYVQFGAQLVPTSGAFTVAMFAQQSSVQGGFRELISQGQTGVSGFYLGHDTAHGIRAGDSWQSTGVAFPSDGLLHHYAVTADATNAKLYVDGVLVASKGSAISLTTSGDNTRLGAQFQTFGENFQGTLDEVWIFGSALAAADIAALAAAVPQTLTVKSDATTLAAATANTAVLDTGVATGLTFAPAAVGTSGTASPVPPGAPTGTLVIGIPPTDGQSGFFKATFTLPATFSSAQILGAANMDDIGRVFLNGNPLTPSTSSGLSGIVTHSGNATFASANAAFFVPGLNELLVSDNNSGGGPSGGSFFANVFFQSVPPPAPTISTPPAAQAVSVGVTAAFSIVATGAPGLTYQWQRQPTGTTGFSNLANGGAYAGTTSAALTVSSVAAFMTGDQFRCVVSDGVNPSVTSAAAQLSVVAGTGIVAISIPVNSSDANDRPLLDATWSVAVPPYPLSQSGIGVLVKPTWVSTGDESDFALHDHVYISPNVPDPARAVVTMAFSAPLVVSQLEVVQHMNGVTRIECFVGNSLDSLVSIGNVFGSAGDVVGSALFTEGASQVFQFTNSTPGRYCRFIIRKTSLNNGWALHRIFPRDGSGQRILGVAAAASLGPVVSAVSPAVLGAGGSVTITGSGFTGATAVTFNGVSAAFTVDSPTQITATVPALATSGNITVTTASGTGSSATAFTVAAVRALTSESTRLTLTSASPTATASFTIEGTAAKTVLIRAVGPSLGSFGIGGVLADPELTLYNSAGAQVAANDDWGNGTAIAAAASGAGAFPLTANSSDSALLVTLNPGTYTALVSAPFGGTGIVLLEVYDTNTNSRFRHVAMRSFAGAGNSTVFSGFTVTGTTAQTFLVRALGPALGFAGALSDPTLSVSSSGGTVIASNDNWSSSTALADATAAVGAMPLGAGSADSALLITLNPGSYTVQLAGVGAASGIAQIEVFHVDGSIAPTKPALLVPMLNSAVNAGGSVTFAAPYVAKPSAVTFQWRKNGAAIPDATTKSLTLGSTTLADAGSYSVDLTNAAGTTNGAAMRLTVVAAGADSLAGSTVISGLSPSAIVHNTAATKETGEPNHGGNTGGKSVWWSWTAPASGQVTISTLGSSFNTVLGVYTGSAVSALTTVASDDDSGGNNTSRVTFNALGGATYQIAVDGSGGASGTISLSVGYGYVFVPFAGETPYGSVDGTGSAARFENPWAVAVDGSGNLFVADTVNHTIRRIGAGGVVTTIAGKAGSSGSADGTGAAARFNLPRGIAVDGAGNVFVADSANQTIRRITPAGVVTTFAGGVFSTGGADGTGATARFNTPQGLAFDGSGNLYVADSGNHTIRKISPAAVVTTLAGVAGSSGNADGSGGVERFSQPQSVAVDATGNVYVADTSNHTVRKIAAGGGVTTVAGTPGSLGSTDATGAAARFFYPHAVAVDGAGNLFVADAGNSTIRKIAPGGVVTTLAGLASSTGSADGTGGAARFFWPRSLVADTAGNLFVADTLNHTIRRVTSAGSVTTVAGLGSTAGSADGTGSAARFNYPAGMAADAAGNVYVADRSNHVIRRISPAGVVATIAGLAGTNGSADGTGSAARFDSPYGVAVDASGRVLVSDTNNHSVRMITPEGVVTTIAGTPGSSGSADGTGSAARFNSPQGLAVDGSGNVFVADTGNFTLRKITAAGVVTTLAGTAGSSGDANGTGAAARFESPRGIALDAAGNLYVADYLGNAIRRITAGGVVTTFTGAPGFRGRIDGPGSDARMDLPLSVAVDLSGNLYVAEKFYPVVRKITPGGTVSTLGQPGRSGSTLGTVSPGWSDDGDGIAVDANGNVYAADSRNNVILKGVPAFAPQIATQPVNQTASPGGTVSFTASPTSALPVTYQWRFNGAPIIGATSGTLTLGSVSGADAGTYAVTVSNLGGSVSSSTVTLTVNSPPVVVASPAHTTAIVGGTLTLTAQVTGSAPLSYQWRYSGPATDGFVNVAGATASTLVMPNFTSANAGSYQLIVSNAFGANVASAVANVVAADPASTWIVDPTFTRPQFHRATLPLRTTRSPVDGKIYLSFTTLDSLTGANNQRLGGVIRLTSTGTVDPSFAPGSSLVSSLALAFQGNGQVLVGGVDANESAGSGATICRVFRLNADGTRDSSYRSPAFAGEPRFMTLQPDGKLLVTSGPFAPGNGIQTLARLNVDGSLDAGFAQPIFDASGAGYIFAPMVVDGSGRILIAGTFTTVNGVTRPNLARLNNDGSLDLAFAPSGFTTSGNGTQIRGIAIQGLAGNAGKILVAGGTLTVSGSNRPVIRLNPTDGSLDPSFTLTTQAAAGMAQCPRMMVLNPANDSFTLVGGSVARFNADGTFDSGFTRPAFSTEAFWIESLADGSVVVPYDVGGTVNGSAVAGPLHFTNTGALDATFDPGVFQSEYYGKNLSVQADSRTLFFGDFDTVNTSARAGFARFNVDGSLDALALSGLANLVGLHGGYVRADGKFLVEALTGTSAASATASVRLFNADGSLNSSAFSLDAAVQTVINSEEPSMEPLADDRILVGSNNAQRVLNGSVYFVRVNANGTLDTTFTGLGATNYGAVYRSGTAITQLVVGEFKILGHYADGRSLVAATTAHAQNASGLPVTLVRLNANGTLDGTFAAPSVSAATIAGVSAAIMDPVTSTTVQPPLLQLERSPLVGAVILSDNRILLGGDFTSLGDHGTTQLARLNANGGIDTSFSTGSGPALRYRAGRQARIAHVSVAAGGKYWVLGVFDTFNGYAAPGIVRLNADGSVDPTFATDLGYRSFISDEARAVVAADGSVFLAGSYAKSGDLMPYALTRLVVPAAVSITTPLPATSSVVVNGAATLSVAAAGSPAPTYQWSFNNQPIAGANGPTYAITNASRADAGRYTVAVSSPFLASPITSSTVLSVVERNLLNLLSRVNVPARGSVSASFTIEGGAKTILIRGVGPSLTAVTGALADPRLTLLNASFAPIAANDDWGTPQTLAGGFTPGGAAAISSAIGAVGAAPGFTAGSKDAALLVTLSPGTYTAVLEGVGGSGGTAQFEVVDTATGVWPRVAMLALRGPVTEANHLVVGFNLTGPVSRDCLIRVLGPTLGYSFGVLVDPVISLYSGSTPGTESLYYNDDWPNQYSETGSSTLQATVADVGGHPFVTDPSYSRYDAAIPITLAPGTYTADIAPYSPGYQSGDVLFEIFNVDGERPAGIAPAITYLARDQAVVAGNTATFGVVALAKPAATFQWRRYLGGVATLISGATSPILTLPSAGASDVGSYDVVISNVVNGVVNTITSPVRSLTLLAEFHSADINHDRQISVAEVTRVIQLYNTRFGATRTGEYHSQANTEDGFAPGAGSITAYHATDLNRDGRIDSDELLRLFELFNYRAGSVRTGEYHAQPGTEDGFVPGPAVSVSEDGLPVAIKPPVK